MVLQPRADSYTYGVKPIENFVWTEERLKQTWDMKINQGRSSLDIAKTLHISKTRVHNAMRRMYRRMYAQCVQCGDPLSEDLRDSLGNRMTSIRCPKCNQAKRDLQHELRERARAMELCGVCHVRPALKGRTACKACISAAHRRRNKKGLCGHCGERPIRKKGKALCIECTVKMRKDAQLRRALNHG